MPEAVALSYLSSTAGINSPVRGTFQQNQTSPDYAGDSIYAGYKAVYCPKFNLTDKNILMLSNPKINGSLEFWFKLDNWGWVNTTANGTPPTGATPIFATYAHDNPFGDIYYKTVSIYFHKGTGFVYGMGDNGSFTFGTITTSTVVQNTWTHVRVTWNKTTNLMKLYLDGVEKGSTSKTLSATEYTGTHQYIGGLRRDYGDEYSMKGWMAGVRHYDYVNTYFGDRFDLRGGMNDLVLIS